MSGPTVQVELGVRSAWFAGDQGLVHAAVRIADCRRQYDPRRRALAVPRTAADDMLAVLEATFGVDVEIVERIEPEPRRVSA